MLRKQISSEFLQYLASRRAAMEADNHLPSLNEISKELGVSVASLREQLEVAKALGLVEVRPRTGMRRLPYSFLPAVRQSLSYSLELDPSYFESFSELRNHVETAFWEQAVQKLTGQDHQQLQVLMRRAWDKLSGQPVQIPHQEHRELHLSIYRRLDNPFVLGILEAYWEAYESIGLNLYTDIEYLKQVWTYHQKMVDSICTGDFAAGYQALLEHTDLIHVRTRSSEGGE